MSLTQRARAYIRAIALLSVSNKIGRAATKVERRKRNGCCIARFARCSADLIAVGSRAFDGGEKVSRQEEHPDRANCKMAVPLLDAAEKKKKKKKKERVSVSRQASTKVIARPCVTCASISVAVCRVRRGYIRAESDYTYIYMYIIYTHTHNTILMCSAFRASLTLSGDRSPHVRHSFHSASPFIPHFILRTRESAAFRKGLRAFKGFATCSSAPTRTITTRCSRTAISRCVRSLYQKSVFFFFLSGRNSWSRRVSLISSDPNFSERFLSFFFLFLSYERNERARDRTMSGTPVSSSRSYTRPSFQTPTHDSLESRFQKRTRTPERPVLSYQSIDDRSAWSIKLV